MLTKFNGTEHANLYKDLLRRDHTHEEDAERAALFYLLALIGEDASRFYDFQERIIKPDSINRPELTGTTRRALTLAYVLYNGFPSAEEEQASNNITSIFGYSEWDTFFLEAIKLRYRRTINSIDEERSNNNE